MTFFIGDEFLLNSLKLVEIVHFYRNYYIAFFSGYALITYKRTTMFLTGISFLAQAISAANLL